MHLTRPDANSPVSAIAISQTSYYATQDDTAILLILSTALMVRVAFSTTTPQQ
ncbi:hypothetical protein IQ277_19190 [Nostocales cyanobacterium LEGE 12452]|nr:hypothetical protein [Nostocales cyanobacterium LEGE 12452]